MTTSESVVTLAKEPSIRAETVRRFLRQPLGVAGAVWMNFIVLASVLAPVVAPYGPNTINLAIYLRGPSASHWLGTDDLGRDVLSRILFGGRPALLGILDAVVPWLVIGTIGGLVAGYRRGVADEIISRIVDVFFAIPALIVLLVIAALYPDSLAVMMVTFGVIASSGLVRIVRSATIAVRDEGYVAAARVSGLGQTRIMFRHILPRITSLIVVQMAVFSAISLVMESGLAFLGLGIQVPNASWGGMIADAHNVITNDGWLLVPPGAAILVTAVALILFGNAVRDVTSARWSFSTLAMRRGSQRPEMGLDAARPDDDSAVWPAPSSSALLSVRNLAVTLEREGATTLVLTDVSFDVGFGETVGLVGESGSGKTTIGNAILGILPHGLRQSGGSCTLLRRDLSLMSSKEISNVRGREIALIAQDPQVSLDPNFTVGSQLREAVRHHTGCSRSAARLRALELLELVKLPEPRITARRYPWQLSGGMAQRVVIALALAGDPKLLIADEPTTALDVTVQSEVLNLLRELQSERGMAVLLISHDWGVIADLCQRAVVCYAGEVVECATVGELFENPLHPYTKSLLSANPHGRVEGEPLPAIRGVVPRLGEWAAGCRFAPRCDVVTSECEAQPVALESFSPGRQCRCIHVDGALVESLS